MHHPPTKHGPKGSPTQGVAKKRNLNPVKRYVAVQEAFAAKLREGLDPGWIADIPIINPAKIIEESKMSPMVAADMCQYACRIWGATSEFKTRELVAAAYQIVFDMKDNKPILENLASKIQDRRSPRGVPKEKVFDEPIHYLFIYIFYQSGMRTRARASEYAQGLRPYLVEGRVPDEVGPSSCKTDQIDLD